MNYDTARDQMLSQQIRTWDVLDQQVLDTLKATHREQFVPASDRDLAFADTEIPLAHGQCMMNPKIEARMLQELAIEPGDHALEVGTGSGYLTACLARMAAQVTSVEFFADLSETASANLRVTGIRNVELRAEDAMTARFDRKFDVVAITASLPVMSNRFTGLLKPGGRLFVVVGNAPIMQAMLFVQLQDGSLAQKSLFETMLTPMINAGYREPFAL